MEVRPDSLEVSHRRPRSAPKETPMTSTPKFAHVVLQTSRFDEMRDWYCTVLDAHVVYEGHGLCFITFDEEHHRVALLGAPVELAPRNPGAAGMHHTAYTFDTLQDLLDRYDMLKAKGIEPKVPIQHGVTTSLYYQDPDGNFVELQIDNFATPEEATEYMHGPEYGNNPVGVSFVPELMREALTMGTPVSEITTHAWALETSPHLPDPMVALTS
ncbi:biphenyl-2,3-diol 1,2-dioxygenase 2 [Rhodococcus aetherivorans]|uniref:Biphenyl-2,3-diol 1,2-dioxygenase 2 n=2 Tax=Nocardiaceae TaxID=85025 RepID=A0ABQ0YF78_9NOCA|nr:biphenyl-2,3-diol 1,2-dioxygenase 2 [Rhodococcus aetherivorans]